VDLNYQGETLASLYYNIGREYARLGNHNQALTFYHKTLDVELMALPDDAVTIVVTYESLYEAYELLGNHEQSGYYAHKAVVQLKKQSNPDQSALKKHIMQAAKMCLRAKKYAEAIEAYKDKVLFQLTTTRENDRSLIADYEIICSCYEALTSI
jgi:tetratricopeptide (TPR) repeat protein